jgi:hypothetical protein
MKRNTRTLLLLGVVFAVLIGLVLWQRLSQTQELERQLADLPGDPLIPGLALQDIQAIRIQIPATEASFTIARDDDGSWVTPGYEGEYTQEQAESLAATIPLIPYYNRLENAAQNDISAYGFRPLGSLLIQVVLSDGRQHAIGVGDISPNRDTYYVILDEQPDIYVVEARAIAFLFMQVRDATA